MLLLEAVVDDVVLPSLDDVLEFDVMPSCASAAAMAAASGLVLESALDDESTLLCDALFFE
ncbi:MULTISPECIES: hypothetical protein [unclassified Caballeronia]|uniref:hypothetical protein n=1 Tax=unclassified Caballeronia TaxID=2646786 RepID=UPI00158A29B6|nr:MULTISPECIES: hypothetical protein [unclassified Caballeronia]QSN64029.1 hypothetical protein JYK05_22195 [Caballeronia sp. M1242]